LAFRVRFLRREGKDSRCFKSGKVKVKRKARALPWTRWGRRPQTPFSVARLFIVVLAKPIIAEKS
jgi:hypothetical protein